MFYRISKFLSLLRFQFILKKFHNLVTYDKIDSINNLRPQLLRLIKIIDRNVAEIKTEDFDTMMVMIKIKGWSYSTNLTLDQNIEFDCIRFKNRPDLLRIFGKNRYAFIINFMVNVSELKKLGIPWVHVNKYGTNTESVPLRSTTLFSIYAPELRSNKSEPLGYVENIKIEFIPNKKINFNVILFNLLFTDYLDYTLYFLRNKNIFQFLDLGALLFHNFHKYSFHYLLFSKDPKKFAFYLGSSSLFHLYVSAKLHNRNFECPRCGEVLEANFIMNYKQHFIEPFADVKDASNYCYKSENIIKLSNAQIYYANIVLKKNINYELDVGMKFSHPFISGRWQYSTQDSDKNGIIFTIKKESSYINSGILLSSKNTQNWYHFLIEDLPKIEYFQDFDPSIPFLISSLTPPNGKALLKLLTNRHIIEIDVASTFEVENLYLPTKASWISDTFPKNLDFSGIDFWLDSHAIKSLHTRVKNLDFSNSPMQSEKIFAGRNSGNYRRILNFNSMKKFLIKKDFNFINLSNLHIKEVIPTVSNSSLIIFSGGAECANMLFMREGSNVVVIYPNTIKNYPVYHRLAELLGINYIPFYADAKVSNRSAVEVKANANYRVNLKKLVF